MDASLFSWTGFAITAAVAVVILVLAFLLVRAALRDLPYAVGSFAGAAVGAAVRPSVNRACARSWRRGTGTCSVAAARPMRFVETYTLSAVSTRNVSCHTPTAPGALRAARLKAVHAGRCCWSGFEA
jgi:hypothetical protein